MRLLLLSCLFWCTYELVCCVGVLVCLLLVVVVSMTPAVASTTWQASQVAPWLQAVLHGLRPMLPADVVKLIPASA